jgi:hypothetical protein
MAKRTNLPFKDLALKIVGPNGAFVASRVQRFEINTNFPSNDIDELGNSNHAGVTTGTPEVTTTFQAMDVSVKIFQALTGSAEPYPAGGVSITQLGDIDVIGQIKDEKLVDLVKLVHGKKLKITGFTYTYTVDGEATEEYTASGSEKRWFKRDVVVDKFTNLSTTYTLTQTPVVLKNGNYALSVIVDGVYFDEVVAAPEAGQYSISGATLTLPAAPTAKVVVVYQADVTASTWESVVDNTIPVGIRGKNIPVTIGVNDIKRVQSITIRGQFPNQKVEEMGNTSVVGYATQVPQVTGDITVLDTDTELVALLTTGEINPSGVAEFNVCEYTASGLALTVELHDPSDKCGTAGSVVKTVYIPNITVTSEGHTTQVGQNAQQTFGFKSSTAELIVYSGAMP